MNTKINNEYKDKTKVIYSMKIAVELISRGHSVITTMPNIKDPRYTVWVFGIDDTFEADFEDIKEGIRNGK